MYLSPANLMIVVSNDCADLDMRCATVHLSRRYRYWPVWRVTKAFEARSLLDAAMSATGTRRAAAHSHKLATRGKRMAGGLSDVVARLVLLPVVGASLCGAVTLMVGLQWVETLQRQRQALKWRARLWAFLLALALALLPSERPEAAVMPHSDVLSNDGEEDDSYASRPTKRQRSEPREGEGNEASAVKEQKEEEEEEEQDQEEQQEEKKKETIPLKPKVRRRVYIWDLDETLVLFASLYTGTFAQSHGKEVAPGVALGEQMMTFLLAMLERHFFFGDLHDADVDHIAHVAAEMDNHAAGSDVPQQPTVQERYERIREIYERRGHVDFLHDADSEWFAIRSALVAAIDNYSTGWLKEARQVLQLITASAHSRVASTASTHTEDKLEVSSDEGEVEDVNVLVTNTQLVPALCKCLIYQLDTFFPIDRVYSSAKIHKYRCFETIMEKYKAPGVEFVAIGDGLEEEQVSLALGLEFHKIRSLVDLKRLRYDLQLVQVNSNASTPSATGVHSPSVATTPIAVASPASQTAVV